MLRRPDCRALIGATLLALSLASVGCGESDPLADVRSLQDGNRDFAGSIEPLRELIESRPDDPEVLFRYGVALLATGNATEALWPLKKAMQSPEWTARVGPALAQAFLSTGAFDDAIEVCTQLLAAKPDDIPILLLRATAYMQSRRNYEAALADADRVLELDPDSGEALVPRAVSLLALERVEEAAVVLDALERLYSDESLGLHGNPGLCAAQATFAKEKREFEKAEKRYEVCLEKFPSDGLVVSDAVAFFDQLGKPERSQSILEKALELSPEAQTFRTALVLRLRAQGKGDEAEAVQLAGTTLASPAAAAEAWAGLAALRLEAEKYGEAVDAYAKARQLDPTQSPQLLFAYADALVLAKRFDEAVELAQGLSVASHRSLILGRVALAKGDPATALDQFSEGLRLWPNNAVARYYAATAAEQLGRFVRAIEEYRYAMRIDATATDAHLRLARLQAAAGRDEAALTTLEFSPWGREKALESILLELRLRAKLGQLKRADPDKTPLGHTKVWADAVAAIADGVRERSGAAAAVEVVRKAKNIDLDDPSCAPALESLLENLAATGGVAEGVRRVEAALRAHPDAAPFHALRARALSLNGSPAGQVRKEYERALEIDPKSTRALVGLARLEAQDGSAESALALYDRAIAADREGGDAIREAAALLAKADRKPEAEERLAALLRNHPYDAEAALTLAQLRLERGADGAGIRELARRAVDFGGGPAAKAFLERVSPPSDPQDPPNPTG